MWHHIVHEEDISGTEITGSYSELAQKFFTHQLAGWDFAARHYQDLEQARMRVVTLSGVPFFIQHTRFHTPPVKSDSGSDSSEYCTFCLSNLPDAQKALPLIKPYLLLVNPYPLVQEHFILSDESHKPQNTENTAEDIIRLAQALSDYTIFFNAPVARSDFQNHRHFHAVTRDKFPLDYAYNDLKGHFEFIAAHSGLMFYGMPAYPAAFFIVEGTDARALTCLLSKLTAVMPQRESRNIPMLNIIAMYRKQTWRLLLFPRRQCQPWQAFAGADKKIALSPGCAEFAGIVSVQRPEDFEKTDAANLKSMLNQAGLDLRTYESLKEEARKAFRDFENDRLCMTNT